MQQRPLAARASGHSLWQGLHSAVASSCRDETLDQLQHGPMVRHIALVCSHNGCLHLATYIPNVLWVVHAVHMGVHMPAEEASPDHAAALGPPADNAMHQSAVGRVRAHRQGGVACLKVQCP